MKIIDACMMGSDCGLTTVEEAVRNVEIHATSLFTFNMMEEELIELHEDYKNYEPEELIVNIIVEEGPEVMPTYFLQPTIVKFEEEVGDEVCENYGIGFGKQIICAHCGQLIDIEDGVKVVKCFKWVDVSALIGEEDEDYHE